MIITCTFVTVIIAIVAMQYIYTSMVRLLTDQLETLDARLAEQKARLIEVMPEFASGQAATWSVDRKNLLMVFDPHHARQIGLPHAEWDVPTFRHLCNPDCYDVFDKWIGKYNLLTDPVCRRLRFHITTDEGKTYHWWELIYILSDKTSHNQIMYGLFINRDDVIDKESFIDDARNTIYQTELKQTFFASINHDLRTPINAIAGFAELLVEQYDDLSEEERMSFADIVQANGEILLQLLADINDVNCNDINKMRFKMRNKSVSEIINMVYHTNKVICPSHLKLNLETEQNHEDKTIYVDPKRVEQVVNNFLSNSFKFTQVGFVNVGWRYIDDTGEVELYVSDTGIGIKEENIPNLFKQFFKVHEHAHGTGLGLNICKSIVEKQDGVIGVESVYGKGSKFYCRFKAA